MVEMHEFITRKQLGIELGQRMRDRPYSEFTLMAWERNGYGPPVTRIGRDVVYRRQAVEDWLLSQETK